MKTSYQAQNDYYNAASQIDICIVNTNPSNNAQKRNSHRVFHRRDSLFSVGDHFEGIYVLRSGSAKSFNTSRDGEEHITKFYYPGDMVGIDGFHGHKHKQTVRFLETSSVCLIKESEIHSLITTSSVFRDGLLQAMSHTLACNSAMMMCLGTYSSEQKLAMFLLDLSVCFSERGLSGSEFMLSMTRTDIANYLGMAIETVSRIFASFQQRNIIEVQLRYLSILDFAALNRSVAIDICTKPNTSLSNPIQAKYAMN
ncbi:helix-turn-helix domain-containing protein [Paraglaciecola sp. MB-3u-78]|uniref:helix-turn-helix domain-containing protein n=1 Tax=Paraglaciecola sp. MB-3u-78 TaxID=2058332 RepID=UPI000C34B212|nr:helix-turn-helix domain-containing protein [Paraglaciecola sp. MB-3u-78]PKG99590.1 Crp/Fnr family transcriptional regulator [Paraglaciecola sp. MB-3u-78]